MRKSIKAPMTCTSRCNSPYAYIVLDSNCSKKLGLNTSTDSQQLTLQTYCSNTSK
uniref:Uncharacterized protein n=1 Tax=Arundo donax TaxID=35708 RepID=A0A0A9GAH7_ARUDO